MIRCSTAALNLMSKTVEPIPGRPLGQTWICALAVVVGLVAGVGSILFRWLIGLFHNLFFLGKLSLVYDANLHTPAGPWGAGIVLAPVVGGMLVVFLVRTFAPEARGHGVPEVMDAAYYNRGIIRPVVALVKAVASALCIGSGGSVGREGPIIQIGSAFGSTLGQLCRIPTWQRVTLIAAGAGGGIAATFNTPIGGILFAAEIVLHEVSVRTLVPVSLATATATYVGRWLAGNSPSFVIPALPPSQAGLTPALLLPAYLALGAFLGLAAVVFIRSLYAMEDFFEKWIPRNEYLRHGVGMLALGVMFEGVMLTTGHYHVAGIGYATVQELLQTADLSLGLLVALFGLKLLATSLTLGSGGSGGIFSPSLFLGAVLGAAWAGILQRLFPGLPVNATAFVVAGMAGMVGGATGAAMTAMVMIFEMTLDYAVIVPMTLTVAVSYGMRKAWLSESIYTMKLARRGHYIPEALQTNFHYLRLARDLKSPRVVQVSGAAPVSELEPLVPERKPYPCFLVARNGGLGGVVTAEAVLQALRQGRAHASAAELATQSFGVISPQTTLFEIITLMRTDHVELFLVAKDPHELTPADVQGWISKERVADSMREAIGLFAA